MEAALCGHERVLVPPSRLVPGSRLGPHRNVRGTRGRPGGPQLLLLVFAGDFLPFPASFRGVSKPQALGDFIAGRAVNL